MAHGAGTALLHRQARLGTAQRLDLTLLVDGQNHGMSRRIDTKGDDVAYVGGELLGVRELRCADAAVPESMRALDGLDLRETYVPDLRLAQWVQWVVLLGGAASVRVLSRSATAGTTALTRKGRVLLHSKASTP